MTVPPKDFSVIKLDTTGNPAMAQYIPVLEKIMDPVLAELRKMQLAICGLVPAEADVPGPWLVKWMTETTGVVYIGMLGDIVVGGCLCTPKTHMQDTMRVHLLGIDKAYRGKGFGKRLTKESVSAILQENPDLKHVTLFAYANNTKALDLYKHLGFSVIGHEMGARMKSVIAKESLDLDQVTVLEYALESLHADKGKGFQVVKLTTVHNDYADAVEHILDQVNKELIEMRHASSGATVTIDPEKHWIRDTVKSGEMEVYAGLLGDVVIGGCMCKTMSKMKDSLLLKLIGLDKAHRGKGHGKQFIKEVVSSEKASHPNLKHADLLVLVNNPGAIKLYEKLGFKPVATEMITTLSTILATEGLTTLPDGIMRYDIGTEAVIVTPAKIQARAKIIAHIVKHMDMMDPAGDNGKRYANMLNAMSHGEFDAFMQRLKAGKEHLHLVAPTFKKTLQTSHLLSAARSLGVEIFQRLWLTDPVSGKKYLTPEKYPILRIPVRRTQQFLDKKISIPANDKRTDALTGQVTGDDRAAGISAPEVHILRTRGLHKTLREIMSIRGGNIEGFGDFKRQMEENGEVNLHTVGQDSRARSGAIVNIFFKAMHLDNNL